MDILEAIDSEVAHRKQFPERTISDGEADFAIELIYKYLTELECEHLLPCFSKYINKHIALARQLNKKWLRIVKTEVQRATSQCPTCKQFKESPL